MPPLDDSKVLVVGGAGFTGAHTSYNLTEEPVLEIVVLDDLKRGKADNLSEALADDRVRVVEGSILDLDLLRELMQGTDYVFHLAALWLYECVNEPRSAVDVNIVGTFNVIDEA